MTQRDVGCWAPATYRGGEILAITSLYIGEGRVIRMREGSGHAQATWRGWDDIAVLGLGRSSAHRRSIVSLHHPPVGAVPREIAFGENPLGCSARGSSQHLSDTPPPPNGDAHRRTRGWTRARCLALFGRPRSNFPGNYPAFWPLTTTTGCAPRRYPNSWTPPRDGHLGPAAPPQTHPRQQTSLGVLGTDDRRRRLRLAAQGHLRLRHRPCHRQEDAQVSEALTRPPRRNVRRNSRPRRDRVGHSSRGRAAIPKKQPLHIEP